MPRKGFPRGHRALTLEGFVFLDAGRCADCGAGVQWWRTPERQRRMPIDAAKKIPHWWICPAVERKGSIRRGLQLDLFAQTETAQG